MQGFKIQLQPSLLFFVLLFSYSLPLRLSAQNRLVPLNKTYDLKLERAILTQEERIHSSFQPLSEQHLGSLSKELDSLQPIFSIQKEMELKGWRRKVFHEHLFILDTQGVKLTLDPIYQFEYTHQKEGGSVPLFKNSRGFLLQLQIAENFAVGSTFLENQARVPGYIADRVDLTKVAYGQGRVKVIDTSFYDFAMSSAYLTYSPSNFINLTIGHGKHFIGNGYRSHLLSDLAFNYPYLKLNTNWWDGKIQYQNLFTLFQDLERIPSKGQTEELFERKFGAIHYLSFMPTSNLEIGLFESTIWPSLDSSGRKDLPGSAYIPVIGLNTLIDNSNKTLSSLVGLNLRYSLAKNTLLYSQLSSNKLSDGLSSYQLGAKYFISDAIRIGVEYNNRKSDSTYSYTHYQESLNLPYGGNQDEWILSAQYMKNRWNFLGRMNVFKGDVDQRFIMGEISFLINPSVNSNVYVNVTHRDRSDLMFISFGWRTSLQNLYFNY